MPVSWKDDVETFRAHVIQIVLKQVRADPEGFKEMTKPRVEQNSRSRRKIKKKLDDVLDWDALVESLPDKVGKAEVQSLWKKKFDPTKLIKGGWSRTEDTLLNELVQAFGTKHWAKFCAYIPGRNGKQCRERWLNHLNPNLKKGPWDQSELETLVKFQRVYGNSWAKIAQHLPGRAENAVKNQWNSMMHRSFSNMMTSRGGRGGRGRANSRRRGAAAGGGAPRGAQPHPDHHFFTAADFNKQLQQAQRNAGGRHPQVNNGVAGGQFRHAGFPQLAAQQARGGRPIAVGVDGAPLLDLGDDYLDSPHSPLSWGKLSGGGNSGPLSTGESFASLGSLGAPSSPERALVNEVYGALSKSAKMRALQAQLRSARAQIALENNRPEGEAEFEGSLFSDDGESEAVQQPPNRRHSSNKRRSSDLNPPSDQKGDSILSNTQEGFSGQGAHNILGLAQDFISAEMQRQELFDSMRLDSDAVVGRIQNDQKRMRGSSAGELETIDVNFSNLHLDRRGGRQQRRSAPPAFHDNSASSGVDFDAAWADIGSSQARAMARNGRRGQSQHGQAKWDNLADPLEGGQAKRWMSVRPGSEPQSLESRRRSGSSGRSSRGSDRWHSFSRINSNEHSGNDAWHGMVPSLGSIPTSLSSQPGSRPTSSRHGLFGGLNMPKGSLGSQGGGFSPSNYFLGGPPSLSGVLQESPSSSSPFGRLFAGTTMLSPTNTLTSLSPMMGGRPGSLGNSLSNAYGTNSLLRMSPTAAQLQLVQQQFQNGEITDEQRLQKKQQLIRETNSEKEQRYSPRSTPKGSLRQEKPARNLKQEASAVWNFNDLPAGF